MRIPSRARYLRSSAAALLVALAWSCGSKINQSNFDRITDGMPREEVESLLGAPTDTRSVGIGGFSGSHATWKARDGTTITIQFVNGKVASKQLWKSEPKS